MYVGADYYPEHWKRDRWEIDADYMQEAGFNVVRLAEFAWAYMEESENNFHFEWLDEILEILHQRNICALLCTPTAAMPAWAKHKYPEVIATDANGNKRVWGVRKNNCFCSGTYRLLSERITRAMAEHFTNTQNVIGWQTDNEFGMPFCYCDTCRAEFQDWLRHKYNTLDNLNAAWGTHFWGHPYTTWGEIDPPPSFGGYNPGLCLDWRRFYSWLNVRFQREQVRIIREFCPDHFVTHNCMGLFRNLDYYALAEDLDFVSWDNYPVWGKVQIPYDASFAADVMRGLKRRNFWIMEQTAGPPGQGAFGRNPRPGEIRKVAYQQLAHGADGQVWFRWRTCTAGREQYWHGLLGHDGEPKRRYREAAQTAQEYHRLADKLADTTVESDIGIVYDYESIWALEIQPGYPNADFQQAIRRYYQALFRNGFNADIIRPEEDFDKYKVILAPHLHILRDETAERLNDFVNKGGILLTDCRTAVKTESNLCHERTLPGLLRKSLGIRIEEYESIPDEEEYEVVGYDNFPAAGNAVRYADWATPETAEKLVGYKQWHLTEFAALTRNVYGNGVAYYVGTIFNEASFYDSIVEVLKNEAGIEAAVVPPEGVEVSVRRGKGKKLLFLINHTEKNQTVTVPGSRQSLLDEREISGEATLEPFGVDVIE